MPTDANKSKISKYNQHVSDAEDTTTVEGGATATTTSCSSMGQTNAATAAGGGTATVSTAIGFSSPFMSELSGDDNADQSCSSPPSPPRKRSRSGMDKKGKKQKKGGTIATEDDNDDDDDDDENDEGEEEDEGEAAGDNTLNPAAFLQDQRVFAKDGEGVYEATILKVALKPSSSPNSHSHEWNYYVHYLGWNSRWDKWLTESDLLSDTPKARALAQKERDKVKLAEKERKQKKEEKEKLKLERKLKRQEALKAKKAAEEAAKRLEEKKKKTYFEEMCTLPFTLRTILVDDRERVTRLGRNVAVGYDDVLPLGCDIQELCRGEDEWWPPRLVHVLPAQITIRSVLNQYLSREHAVDDDDDDNNNNQSQQTEKNDKDEEESTTRADDNKNEENNNQKSAMSWKEFVEGILTLFDDALPVYLLYKQERPQYLALTDNESESRNTKRKCDLYGCEHLLRLLLRLPAIVNYASKEFHHHQTNENVDESDDDDSESINREEEIENLGEKINDLIVFLQKNVNACFKAQYREPTEDELLDCELTVVKKFRVAAASNANDNTNTSGDGGGEE